MSFRVTVGAGTIKILLFHGPGHIWPNIGLSSASGDVSVREYEISTRCKTINKSKMCSFKSNQLNDLYFWSCFPIKIVKEEFDGKEYIRNGWFHLSQVIHTLYWISFCLFSSVSLGIWSAISLWLCLNINI